jgi:hypothetical protein
MPERASRGFFLRMQRTARPNSGNGRGILHGRGPRTMSGLRSGHRLRRRPIRAPEVKRGLWPYMVTALLMRHVGPKKALELCMTGERISAHEAEKLGLITRCVPKGELQKEAYEMARKIASLSPAVLALGKRSFYTAWDLPSRRPSITWLRSSRTILSSRTWRREYLPSSRKGSQCGRADDPLFFRLPSIEWARCWMGAPNSRPSWGSHLP